MQHKENTVNARAVGRREYRNNGWFNREAGELVPGLPITPGMRVVDVGCGGGQFSTFCANLGADITAIDIDREKVDAVVAQLSGLGKGSVTGLHSDASPIPLDDGYADLVLCTEVVEHVREPARLMGELQRIAKPGAPLWLSVPDGRSENLILDVAAPQYFQEPNHINIFSAEEFAQLVLDSGLTIDWQQGMGAFWSLFYLFKWATAEPGEGLVDDVHPITQQWSRLWWQVMEHPDGESMVAAMNKILPKTQVILARKPGVAA